MYVCWKKAPVVFVILFSFLFAKAESLGISKDPHMASDQYVNRVDFVNAALAICRSVRSQKLKLIPNSALDPNMVHYIEKLTGMNSVQDKVDTPDSNDLFPTFQVVLKKGDDYHAATFYMTTNHASFSIRHHRYIIEDIARVIMDTDCNHYRSKLAFFDANEKLVLRQFLAANGTVSKSIITKQEVKSIQETNNLTTEQLQKIQDQQKVTVAIIDQGVDYNHSKIAAKMRPNQKRIQTLEEIKASLVKNQPNLGWLDRLILQFTNPDWFSTHQANTEHIEKMASTGLQDEKEVGKDLVENDSLPYDYSTAFDEEAAENKNQGLKFDHGTHVADVASRYNDIKLLPIRIGNRASLSGEAIEYAARRGARVINLSMGSSNATDWSSFEQGMKNHPDILFVVAAGNESQNIDEQPTYPAGFTASNMIVVASVDRKGNLSWFSNFGVAKVHIAAFGEEVLAATPQNHVGVKSGTSMATPQVSRVAAEMIAIHPDLRPEQAIQILLQTSVSNFSTRGKIMAGILNEKKALQVAKALAAENNKVTKK